MTKYLHYLIPIVFFGCAPKAPVTIEPLLLRYMDSFTKDIGVADDGISVDFQDLGAPVVGQCIFYGDGSREIQVDTTYWNNMTDDGKQQLMYHELGHCAVRMQYHIFTLLSDSCPTSIMYPDAFGGSACYSSNQPYYFKELQSHDQGLNTGVEFDSQILSPANDVKHL